MENIHFCAFASFFKLESSSPHCICMEKKVCKNIRIFIFGELSQKWDGDKG